MKTLSQITKAISSQIKATAQQAFIIGENLELAKAHFTKENGTQDGKAFVTWADDTFGLKKASVYNYITIARVFGDKAQFASVGIQVLTKIMRDETMLKDAEEALAEGAEINAEWVKAHTRNKGAKAKTEKEPKGDEWDVDNVSDLKKEIKRLKAENKKQAETLTKERQVTAKILAENEALKAELASKAEPKAEQKAKSGKEQAHEEMVRAAYVFLKDITELYECSDKDNSDIFKKNGGVKASFKSRVHPDKVSHLGDAELTKLYSDFFKTL